MKKLISFIKKLSNSKELISLHEPIFEGNEKKYLLDCIDSTYVSSTGKYIDKLEKIIVQITNSKHAIATVNGTSALHLALIAAGVDNESEVITQPLTFVATCNAISYTGAKPIFVDVDKDTMGLSPSKLKKFLICETKMVNRKCLNKSSGKIITACVPMHTFGFPCRIKQIKTICDEYNINLVEDSAEGLGSKIYNKSVGSFGMFGVFSFNGNKIVTGGGGGIVVTDNDKAANLIRHISTTSKVKNKWDYIHDNIGYNYRMPNLNAALLCAQIEQLDLKIERKKNIFNFYKNFLENSTINIIDGIEDSQPNYWLNTLTVNNKKSFLEYSNSKNVMTRPAWKLMNKLTMFKSCQCGDLSNAIWLEKRIVNIPSNIKLI